jgi:hypothetical protein
MGLYRFSTGSGGIAVPIIKHDSTSPTLPAQIVASTGMSYTLDLNGYIFKRMCWSTKEPLAANAGLVNEFETNPNYTSLWDCSKSYSISNLEPLVLRPGYGVGIVVQLPTGGSIGSNSVADFWMEFTAE